METIEALIHRRSCRKYSDRPVEVEKLARIIEAGQYAPSGMGRQPVTFVAVTDPATVERLSQLNAQVMGSNSDPFYGAKTVVVVLVDRSVPTHLEDGSLAMGNLLNAAYALGVDSCWIHRAHEVFDSPEGLELLASWDLPADGSQRQGGQAGSAAQIHHLFRLPPQIAADTGEGIGGQHRSHAVVQGGKTGEPPGVFLQIHLPISFHAPSPVGSCPCFYSSYPPTFRFSTVLGLFYPANGINFFEKRKMKVCFQRKPFAAYASVLVQGHDPMDLPFRQYGRKEGAGGSIGG